jgi:predicted lipoprotein
MRRGGPVFVLKSIINFLIKGLMRAGFRTVAFVAAQLVATGACDRIGYYSISGSAGAGDGPSGASGSAGTGTGTVSRAMVLAGVATCAEALYAGAATASAELDAAAATLAASPSEQTEAAAREAWKKAIGLWQQAEVIRVGPAGPTTAGGEGLRDYVYSWPLVSRCLVEQNLVSQEYAETSFAATALVNTRGLAAAEYLLFYDGSDNACSASSSINVQGTWNALGPVEIAARKRAYASVVAYDVAQKTGEIHARWAGADGFGAALANAGASSSPFDSDQAALNAVSDGLFYVEVEVKDMKLGLPLGKVDACPGSTCPGSVESLYARVARDHVRNNLVGFERVWAGCDAAAATGFDDLLRSVGSGDLADRMAASLDGAIAAADALESADFVTLLETDKAGLEALHTAVKSLTDLLKTEFVTVLDLELPKSVEGDND